MAKNWAIAIGINQYSFLPALNYARQDAVAVQTFLLEDAKFEQVLRFTDEDPLGHSLPTYPSRTNLLRLLRQLTSQSALEPGDNLWVFFSGHGIRHQDRDYLLPVDGDLEDVENTAIAIPTLTESLRRCGADNVVLILDACRQQNTRSSQGIGSATADLARQTGVITLFSCSPNEVSYELEPLQQGMFTYALLEGLGVQGQCATVDRLHDYLMRRVQELSRQYRCPVQTPYLVAEPITKRHLILLPHYASPDDIATLKTDAYRAAQLEQNLELSEYLWIRVLAASSGKDMEAVRALQSIAQLRQPSQQLVSSPTVNESPSPSPTVLGTALLVPPDPTTGLRLDGFPQDDAPVCPSPAAPPQRSTWLPSIRRWLSKVVPQFPHSQSHTGAITALALSPDGSLLASGSQDHTLRLWHLPDGTLQHCYRGHTEAVTSVAISADGRWLASGSGDNTINLWNVQTGELQATLKGHLGWVLSLAFCPTNSAVLVSGSADGTLKLWDWQLGQEQTTLTGHQGWVSAIALSPDGTLLASGSHDQTIKLWRLRTGTLLKTLTGHGDRLVGLGNHPNGKVLVSVDQSGRIGWWHWHRGKLLRWRQGNPGVRAIAFCPKAPLLATVHKDGSIQYWQLQQRNCLGTWGGSNGAIVPAQSPTCVSFRSSQQLYAGYEDGSIRLQPRQPRNSAHLWLTAGTCLVLGLLGMQLYVLAQEHCASQNLPLSRCLTDHPWRRHLDIHFSP